MVYLIKEVDCAYTELQFFYSLLFEFTSHINQKDLEEIKTLSPQRFISYVISTKPCYNKYLLLFFQDIYTNHTTLPSSLKRFSLLKLQNSFLSAAHIYIFGKKGNYNFIPVNEETEATAESVRERKVPESVTGWLINQYTKDMTIENRETFVLLAHPTAEVSKEKKDKRLKIHGVKSLYFLDRSIIFYDEVEISKSGIIFLTANEGSVYALYTDKLKTEDSFANYPSIKKMRMADMVKVNTSTTRMLVDYMYIKNIKKAEVDYYLHNRRIQGLKVPYEEKLALYRYLKKDMEGNRIYLEIQGVQQLNFKYNYTCIDSANNKELLALESVIYLRDIKKGCLSGTLPISTQTISSHIRIQHCEEIVIDASFFDYFITAQIKGEPSEMDITFTDVKKVRINFNFLFANTKAYLSLLKNLKLIYEEENGEDTECEIGINVDVIKVHNDELMRELIGKVQGVKRENLHKKININSSFMEEEGAEELTTYLNSFQKGNGTEEVEVTYNCPF